MSDSKADLLLAPEATADAWTIARITALAQGLRLPVAILTPALLRAGIASGRITAAALRDSGMNN